MKEPNGITVRSIRWMELFPWLVIGRCFRLAIAPRMLVLGALGIVAQLVGWWFLAWLFGSDGQPNPWFQQTLHATGPIEIINRAVADSPNNISLGQTLTTFSVEGAVGKVSHSFLDPLQAIFSLQPLVWRDRCFLILSALLTVAIWAYCGGAISRMAAVQLAADEKLGFIAATRWARKKWLSYFVAPLFPLMGVALAAIPLWVMGVLQKSNVGVLITGPFWFIALGFGFVMALLMMGLAYGWPLMWATISVEGTDSFDALSRTYAYVLQRPLRYAWYIFVSGLVGLLGMLVVFSFASAVLWLTSWGVSLGSGGPRATSIAKATSASPDQPDIDPDLDGSGSRMGLACIAFWRALVKSLALGYEYSYFWTASTSIYLLMRRDVDATEIDEVFLDADASERVALLPPITKDAAGAPQIVPVALDGQPIKDEEPNANEPQVS